MSLFVKYFVISSFAMLFRSVRFRPDPMLDCRATRAGEMALGLFPGETRRSGVDRSTVSCVNRGHNL